LNLYNYKEILDYAIVEILNAENSCLKFDELKEKIEKYCRISTSTLTYHLKTLAGRNIIERTLLLNGRATYSLTEKFKDASEIQRKYYPTSYWKETFSLETFSKDTFWNSPSNLPNRRFKIYWPLREGKPPSWWLPSWQREFYKKRRELSKKSGKEKQNKKKTT
jgi:DNA-binding HxlR family transcriptional regulator